jgi:hypothetical protein
LKSEEEVFNGDTAVNGKVLGIHDGRWSLVKPSKKGKKGKGGRVVCKGEWGWGKKTPAFFQGLRVNPESDPLMVEGPSQVSSPQ